jgi:hypothetical protein
MNNTGSTIEEAVTAAVESETQKNAARLSDALHCLEWASKPGARLRSAWIEDAEVALTAVLSDLREGKFPRVQAIDIKDEDGNTHVAYIIRPAL